MLIAVEIRFQQEDYSVCEGQGGILVCVDIIGQAQNAVTFSLSTQQTGSAGELVMTSSGVTILTSLSI